MSEHTDTNPKLVLDTDNIVGPDHTYWPKHIRIEQSRYLEGMDPEGILALEMFDNDTGPFNCTAWLVRFDVTKIGDMQY